MSAEKAAHACQAVINAAEDFRLIRDRVHDLCFLQVVLADARKALRDLDDAVSTLGWKVVYLENKEALRQVDAVGNLADAVLKGLD